MILYLLHDEFCHFVLCVWLDRHDNCSIVFLDPKKLWLDVKIITVACIHSKLELIQILLSAIMDFGGSYLIFWGLIHEIIVRHISWPQKPMTRRQNYNCSLYTFEVRANSNLWRQLWILVEAIFSRLDQSDNYSILFFDRKNLSKL